MIQTYALIENGMIGNVIDCTEEVAVITFPAAIRIDNLTPVPGIGWTYVDGAFIAPVVADDSGNAK